MSKHTLTCPCGHTWEHSGSADLPADLRLLCPLCAARTQETCDQSSREDVRTVSEPAPRDLKPGDWLSGYEILGEINRGGMGIIYKARQQGLNRLVALKIIAPERLSSDEAMKRFQREVQAAALLSHPNIVTVYQTDLAGRYPFLAMEFVPGIDLLRLVKQAGPLPILDACTYIQQAAHGLQHAFEQGLVHRDIKPANLMVTPSPLESSRVEARAGRRLPRVKILDMGLARVKNLPEGASNLTRFGEFLGTPDFIAPEQAEDPRDVDIRADLYSLGSTLYFLLTAAVPFPGTSLMQKLRQQLTDPSPPVSAHRPDVPPALVAVLTRLMAREPDQRYQTPAEVSDALGEILRAPDATVSAAQVRPSSLLQPALMKAPGSPSPATKTAEVPAHPGGVRVLALSGDGLHLLSGGLDEVLRVWDANKLREIKTVTDVGPVESCALTHSGKWGASCALRLMQEDMVVQLWDLATGEERRRLRGATDNLRCVALAPDGRRVAAGSDDKLLRVWALDQPPAAPLVLKGHTETVTSVAFLPDGASLVSGSADGTVRLWDARTATLRGTLTGGVGKVTGVAFGGLSKRLAWAGNGLRVRQADGSIVALIGHLGPVLGLAFAPDGALLASAGADHTVRIWRTNGDEVAFGEHTGKVHAVAFAPDGKTVFSGSADGTIRRWTVLA